MVEERWVRVARTVDPCKVGPEVEKKINESQREGETAQPTSSRIEKGPYAIESSRVEKKWSSVVNGLVVKGRKNDSNGPKQEKEKEKKKKEKR